MHLIFLPSKSIGIQQCSCFLENSDMRSPNKGLSSSVLVDRSKQKPQPIHRGWGVSKFLLQVALSLRLLPFCVSPPLSVGATHSFHCWESIGSCASWSSRLACWWFCWLIVAALKLALDASCSTGLTAFPLSGVANSAVWVCGFSCQSA